MTASRQISLVLFHEPSGRVLHGWRREGSRVEDLLSLEWAAHSAQVAEAACFDGILYADIVFFEPGINPQSTLFEPITTLGAVAAVTKRIGLIPTISTTFTQPYNTARMLSNLDLLSKGRVGWNVVTSEGDGAKNLSTVMPPKAERYEVADEFLEVTKALWDAWDDDAVEADRETGIWANPAKIHPPNFSGKYFQVKDALSQPRSPQGRPVIVQAGQSPEGIRFAARHAEVVFCAKNTIDLAKEFYDEVKGLAQQFGRDPERIKILPGFVPIVGETVEEAREIHDEINGLFNVEWETKELRRRLMDADLSGLSLDEPIPIERLKTPEEVDELYARMQVERPGSMRFRKYYDNVYRRVVEQRPTLREMLGMSTSSHHAHMAGTASMIADEMQRWFEARACDGFTIVPVYMPDGLDRICNLLIPELQDRGLFRTEYPGTTLRETLGLERPAVPPRPPRVGETDSSYPL